MKLFKGSFQLVLFCMKHKFLRCPHDDYKNAVTLEGSIPNHCQRYILDVGSVSSRLKFYLCCKRRLMISYDFI